MLGLLSFMNISMFLISAALHGRHKDMLGRYMERLPRHTVLAFTSFRFRLPLMIDFFRHFAKTVERQPLYL